MSGQIESQARFYARDISALRMVKKMLIKRGDIFYADLSPSIGSEESGCRPVIVIQNDAGNKHSPTIIVIPLSTAKKKKLPVHIKINEVMPQPSTALAEQIRTIDKSRLREYIGTLDNAKMAEIDEILRVSIGI